MSHVCSSGESGYTPVCKPPEARSRMRHLQQRATYRRNHLVGGREILSLMPQGHRPGILSTTLARISALPFIQLSRGQWIELSWYQVVLGHDIAAISGRRLNVKNQTQPKPASATLSSTTYFEGLTGDPYSTANLSALRAGEVDNATESGAELIRRCNGGHDKCFVTQT